MRLTQSVAGTMPVFNRTIFGTGSVSMSATELKVDRKNIATLVLSPTVSSIAKLAQLEANWDNCGSARPEPAAIQRARTLVEGFYRFAGAAGAVTSQWSPPHISASEDGEVVMEWWHNAHKLTVYVSGTTAQYLKVWGPNITTQMEDGLLEGNQFQGLWLWLNA
jgi:hypothetical protein